MFFLRIFHKFDQLNKLVNFTQKFVTPSIVIALNRSEATYARIDHIKNDKIDKGSL